MKSRKHSQHYGSKTAEIKMTPMIDVIFLLLVFFVCTANFTPPEEILPMDASLPGSVVADVRLPDLENLDVIEIKIELDHALTWHVMDSRFTTLQEVHSLLHTIHSIRSNIPVIIESADNVSIENVIDLYDVCRRVGLLRVQFAAD